jgi:hypothetical protein
MSTVIRSGEQEQRQTPGAGALLQLQSVGKQDTYLYALKEEDTSSKQGGNPFTKTGFLASSRGAIEHKEEVFEPFYFGKTNTISVPRRGDLLGDIYLQITLPAVPGAGVDDYWLQGIGYILLRRVKLLLNETEINSDERLYYDIYDQMFQTENIRLGVQEMIGTDGQQRRLTQAHSFLIPLKFFCCKKRYGNARQTFMPLLATPGSTIYIDIEAESFENCITSYAGNTPPETLTCSLVCEFVFVDNPERESLINQPQLLMIEKVQDAEGFSSREIVSADGTSVIYATDTVVIPLNEINFPVKCLLFVAYFVDDVTQKRYFQYADIIQSASVRFDGNDRTDQLQSTYFQLLQPYLHAPRCNTNNIYLYSFALDPGLLQPTGAFTFANVRRPELYVKLAEARRDVVVKVFALGYTWIQFVNGRASPLFS